LQSRSRCAAYYKVSKSANFQIIEDTGRKEILLLTGTWCQKKGSMSSGPQYVTLDLRVKGPVLSCQRSGTKCTCLREHSTTSSRRKKAIRVLLPAISIDG
jgi:hypothetical protein